MNRRTFLGYFSALFAGVHVIASGAWVHQEPPSPETLPEAVRDSQVLPICEQRNILPIQRGMRLRVYKATDFEPGQLVTIDDSGNFAAYPRHSHKLQGVGIVINVQQGFTKTKNTYYDVEF